MTNSARASGGRGENPAATPRLKSAAWSNLDDTQREVYRSVVGTRSIEISDDDGLPGPFNAMLYSPDVGGPLQALGAAIRSTSSIPARAREIATLTVAAHFDSEYEWFRHSEIASTMGVTDSELAELKKKGPMAFDDPLEQAVVVATRNLLEQWDLTDPEYEEAIQHLDEPGMVTLSTLVGYYSLLAVQLRLFRVPLPTYADSPDEQTEGA
jgi:4-carboxymuconolactone decarboxylase